MATNNITADKARSSSPSLQKSKLPNEQNKTEDKFVKPGNDSSNAGAPANAKSSNKGQGPKGENL